MKTRARIIGLILSVAAVCLFAVSSSQATLLTCDFVPLRTQAFAGMSSRAFSLSGFSVGLPHALSPLSFRNGLLNATRATVVSTSDPIRPSKSWISIGTVQFHLNSVFPSVTNNHLAMAEISGDALPPTMAASPEISAIFPIIGLITAIGLTQYLRRRRMAQLRGTSR